MHDFDVDDDDDDNDNDADDDDNNDDNVVSLSDVNTDEANRLNFFLLFFAVRFQCASHTHIKIQTKKKRIFSIR